MIMKRALVIILLLGLVRLTALRPHAAYADTSGALVIAGLVTAGYLAIILTTTAIIYRAAPPLAVTLDDVGEGQRGQTVGVARQCAQSGGNLTLLCW